MTNTEIIRAYLEVAIPGQLQLDRIREFLADDVKIEDPLMSIDGADEFVGALRALDSGGGMRSTVQDVVGSDDVVSARILFEMAGTTVQFSQWFWLADGKISRVQVIYDPRPFLEMSD